MVPGWLCLVTQLQGSLGPDMIAVDVFTSFMESMMGLHLDIFHIHAAKRTVVESSIENSAFVLAGRI